MKTRGHCDYMGQRRTALNYRPKERLEKRAREQMGL
jgi:hypothetical protein